ncbi:MAG: hypothetical protein FWB83_01730 [Treponema sp.]|nr:hypothetical protein [Treponema sp.]
MTDEKTLLANRERQRKFREAHRAEINEQRRDKYNTRIAKGKCPRCGGKVKKGYTLCEECCEYQANLNRKYAKQKKKPAGKTAVKKAAPKKAAAKKATPKKTDAKAAPKAKKTIKKTKVKK